MNHSTHVLEPLVKQWAVLLTTYRRDGTPVGTAVNIVVEGDLAYFRTWDAAWKLRCIRNNPEVEFAPSRRSAGRRRRRSRPAPGCSKAESQPAPEGARPQVSGHAWPPGPARTSPQGQQDDARPADTRGARSGEQTRCGAAEAGITTGHEERASFCPHLLFYLTAGVFVGLGLSGASFTIVIAALGRLVAEDKISQAMGLATAAGSLGRFVFAPLGQAFLTDYGWQAALLFSPVPW